MSESCDLLNAPDQAEKISQSRFPRNRRSGKSRLKILLLSITLALAALALVVISIFSFSKIASLGDENRQLKQVVQKLELNLETLMPQLEKSKADISDLLNQRFPNLKALEINRVMNINQGLINNVVFTMIKQGEHHVYKYLLVVENKGDKKINPSFRVLLFDEFGVHIGSTDVSDSRVLKVGESRDYVAEFDLLFNTTPKHFYIEDLSAQYNTENN